MAKTGYGQIGNMMRDAEDVWRLHPRYYLFEPWDVPERPKWVRALARKDSIDLAGEDIVRCVGLAPRGFQTGYLLSTHYGRVLFAASQVGKSLVIGVEILTRATGEIPYALRYPAGHDTGIPREITSENVFRWGRHSKDTGKILDHNVRAIVDGSWDCGNVTGVGVFPQSKIVEPGSMIRLVSYQSMITQNWWPAFTGETGSQLGKFVPGHLIDKTEGSPGNRGYHAQEKLVHLLRGVKLKMLTYEAQKRGLEGAEVLTYLDEEPPKEDLWGALLSHATDWSLSETPWLGVTWSKDIAFPEVVTDHKITFQASAYDCPYKTPEKIERFRAEMADKLYEIGARIWGMPTAQKGKPFYDRDKINFWMNRFKLPYKFGTFRPTNEWEGIKTDLDRHNYPGLLDTPITFDECTEDDERAVWRMYEDRQESKGYVASSDQAEGAETAKEAGDRSTCVMARQHEEDPTRPVCAATLRSTLPVYLFTREVMYAARYYHNALLAPESGRGAANEAFKAEAFYWPWWLIDTMIRQSTRKAKDYRGFCPTTDRRGALYDRLIREWLDKYGA